MAAKKDTSKSSSPEVVSEVLKITTGRIECCVLGTSPLICNRMSEKAKRELLMPRGRKTAVEKATSLKHDPIREYQASPYTLQDDEAPTYLAALAAWFKRALCSAALDLPGARKAQVGRLTWVEGERIPLYGVPKLFMSVTRSADMARTPDVRTRAIVPQWATVLTVRYVEPLIRAQAVANLVGASGITMGVGDWRQEKGSGSYGQFVIVSKDDPTFLSILKNGGRKAQLKAMEEPVAYDDDTTELMSWYDEELARRQLKGVA